MYNIGYCKICKQGLLEIVKDKLTKKIFICCDAHLLKHSIFLLVYLL
jgi:hypothetical protein